jgi:release factor glutamine methyltransferase
VNSTSLEKSETTPETWTILRLLQWTTDYFSHRGIHSARLDAELIVSFTLGLTRVQLYTQFDRPLTPEELKKIKELVKRRAHREPLAYLRGTKEFFSMEFIVSPAVLIPRPETEILVEEALKIGINPPNPPLEKGGEGGFIQVLDIGTGSGCISITLAKHLPHIHVWAVDISPAALEIAKINAKKHQVEDRITFLKWDLMKDTWIGPPANFDMIVSNPPYIAISQLSQLAPEIFYEPKMALEAGEEGLQFYPALLSFASAHLKPQGCMLFEIGEGQSEKLVLLCQEKGFENVEVIKDLSGKPRVLKLQHSSA